MENESADIVLSSNAIFTCTGSKPIEGKVAIKGNKIQAVGSDQEISPLIGDDTKVFDYQDKLIMPGFNDFHIHLFLGSLFEDSVQLDQAKSEIETAEMVKKFADQTPDEPWIFGFNWYHVRWENQKLPHRSTLDKFIPDRPVFLLNEECHGAWVNTKALEEMGIDKNTPDPPFGKIERDEHGEATGFLYETAMTYAQKVFNGIPKEKQMQLLDQFLAKAARLGVTSVTDMLPLPGLELGNLDLYREYDETGRLTTRVHFCAALDGDLSRPRELREKYKTEKLQFSGLKQFLDGVPTAYTAYMVHPYHDKPDTAGDTLIPPKDVKQWISHADKENFRVRLHACGDGAVRLGLDAFEEAINDNGNRDARHTIEHIEVIHRDDVSRFSGLGVIASMQPEHMASEDAAHHNYVERLGKEREKDLWAIKSLEEHGAEVAYGTDFPVVELNPCFEIYRAISRIHDDGLPENGWNPQEKVCLANALKSYTIKPAYGLFREEELGTLEKGKLADIIVLDRNLFQSSFNEVKDANIELTMMDGDIIYNRNN